MGDDFSDPRRRSATGRGRGRGRGRGKTRGRGRGRGTASTSHVASRQPPPRRKDDLGTNADRYDRDGTAMSEEEDYDAGVDFDQAAAARYVVENVVHEDTVDDGADLLLRELTAEFGALEEVLGGVPLWVRLGEFWREVVGVPEDDVIDQYLEQPQVVDGGAGMVRDVGRNILEGLGDLGLDDSEEDGDEGSVVDEVASNADVGVGGGGSLGKLSQEVDEPEKSGQTSGILRGVIEDPVEDDDFDKWLDNV